MYTEESSQTTSFEYTYIYISYNIQHYYYKRAYWIMETDKCRKGIFQYKWVSMNDWNKNKN